MIQQPLLSPAEELALAKASDGMELSAAAQALYEAEGAARFAQFHGNIRIQEMKESKHGN